jgi:hypothetical protein
MAARRQCSGCDGGRQPRFAGRQGVGRIGIEDECTPVSREGEPDAAIGSQGHKGNLQVPYNNLGGTLSTPIGGHHRVISRPRQPDNLVVISRPKHAVPPFTFGSIFCLLHVWLHQIDREDGARCPHDGY